MKVGDLVRVKPELRLSTEGATEGVLIKVFNSRGVALAHVLCDGRLRLFALSEVELVSDLSE